MRSNLFQFDFIQESFIPGDFIHRIFQRFHTLHRFCFLSWKNAIPSRYPFDVFSYTRRQASLCTYNLLNSFNRDIVRVCNYRKRIDRPIKMSLSFFIFLLETRIFAFSTIPLPLLLPLPLPLPIPVSNF